MIEHAFIDEMSTHDKPMAFIDRADAVLGILHDDEVAAAHAKV